MCFSQWTLMVPSERENGNTMCVCVHLANTVCEIERERRRRRRGGCHKQCSSACISSSKAVADPQSLQYQGVGLLAPLTADTFHATAVNSSTGVCITNSWRTCAGLAVGGREACLLCKRLLSSFASFFISSSPTPLPLSAHTWFLQEPSSDNTLHPHT